MSESHTNENHEHEIVVSFIPPKRWFDRAKWRLVEDYTSHNDQIKVPAGFVSDGATIVWALRWLFSPTGRYFGAAIVHDYLIVVEKDWRKANREFDIEMVYLGVPWWIRASMVSAVETWSAVRGRLHETRLYINRS